ncbi:hypothetical protein HQQ81_10635 [Microbacteriaceae bacterium VKM Ac-2854]|nr:hypothetical protein [Microbacteriaceae bacterium VKM Ac-2854]
MWFRRRKKFKLAPFNPDDNPVADPISVEEATEEGLMLAEYASRMNVKNRILIEGLTSEKSFDPTRFTRYAGESLEALAQEQTLAATRIRETLHDASVASGRSAHIHDYRPADVDNLDHREKLSLAVAATLRYRAIDPEYLLALVERAREDAWREVSQSIEENLDRTPIIDVTEEYNRDRDVRMALIVIEDLAKLAEERGTTLE